MSKEAWVREEGEGGESMSGDWWSELAGGTRGGDGGEEKGTGEGVEGFSFLTRHCCWVDWLGGGEDPEREIWLVGVEMMMM